MLAVDRDRDGLQALRGVDAVQAVCADLETDGLPTASRFAAVVVTDYLWRPLLPGLLAAVGPGGVLLYETFMDGQQTIGRPRRPEFLLEPDELARCTSPLSIVAFEQGLDLLTGNFRQRIVAVRLPAGTSKIPAALRQDD